MSKDDEAKIMAAVKPKLAKFKGESDALYADLDIDKNGAPTASPLTCPRQPKTEGETGGVGR